MKDFFKPELRNRLDMICKFNKLDSLAIKKIVIKFIDELKISLTDKKIILTLTEAAVDLLAEKGYDSKMGARPLARKIDELIRVPLSKKILFDRLRDCTVRVDVKDGEITFDCETSVPEQPRVTNEGYIVIDRFKPKN
jgi:ATP-dependent Clp protease ATP-binding subunit ClpA